MSLRSVPTALGMHSRLRRVCGRLYQMQSLWIPTTVSDRLRLPSWIIFNIQRWRIHGGKGMDEPRVACISGGWNLSISDIKESKYFRSFVCWLYVGRSPSAKYHPLLLETRSMLVSLLLMHSYILSQTYSESHHSPTWLRCGWSLQKVHRKLYKPIASTAISKCKKK